MLEKLFVAQSTNDSHIEDKKGAKKHEKERTMKGFRYSI